MVVILVKLEVLIMSSAAATSLLVTPSIADEIRVMDIIESGWKFQANATHNANFVVVF